MKNMPDPFAPMDVDLVLRESVLKAAQQLFDTRPQWPVFHAKVFGPNGLVRQTFSDPYSAEEFAGSDEYRELKRMLADLRTHVVGGYHRTITVRMPPELHETLRREAALHGVSMNGLCLAKLLESPNEDLLKVIARQEEP